MREKLKIEIKEKIAYFENAIVNEIMNTKKIVNIYRVFKNDKLGISYLVNNDDHEYGYKLAEKNMIYDYAHATKLNDQKNIIANESKMTQKDIVQMLEEIGTRLNKITPNIKLEYIDTSIMYTLTNEDMLHIHYEDAINTFILKHKDKSLKFEYKKIDIDNVVFDMESFLSLEIKPYVDKSYTNIILSTRADNIYDIFEKELSAKRFIENNNKDKKLFSKKLSLYTSLSSEDAKSSKYGILPFFDWEGSYNTYYRNKLIENGVMLKPYTNKDISKEMELEGTACSYAIKDEYPQPKLLGAYIESGKSNLAYMINDGIFIKDADVTFENDKYKIDIKHAYLYENNELTVRVKPKTIIIDAYELFSDNFVGVSNDYLFGSDMEKAMVFKNIKDVFSE